MATMLGMFIRGYKAFTTIQFIPFTTGYQFTALIGDNGIGKSSVLEALDTAFNDREFNRNKTFARRGTEISNIPFVSPVFAVRTQGIRDTDGSFSVLDKTFRDTELFQKDYPLYEHTISSFLSKNDPTKNPFFILSFTKYFSSEREEYFYPITDVRSKIVENITNQNLSKLLDGTIEGKIEDKTEKRIKINVDKIRKIISYLYLPVESNDEHFLTLHSDAFIKLSSKDVKKDILGFISETKIRSRITDKVDEILKGIGHELKNEYEYKNKIQTRSVFRDKKILDLVISEYLKSKTLHKKTTEKNVTIPFESLSAGEKTQATLQLCLALLNSSKDVENIVIGIDEPEASLHKGRIFGQFETLHQASEIAQILVTTHWYGFVPLLEKGYLQSMSKTSENKIQIKSFDLYNFFDGNQPKSQGESGLPHDTHLRGQTELSQSILHSLINPDVDINWILCEGVTDKIYLRLFLDEDNEKLKIIPLNGVSAVIRIYNLLTAMCASLTSHSELNGKVLCLTDSDNQLTQILKNEQTDKSKDRIIFRRLYLDSRNTENSVELQNESSITIEKTTIENCLPADTFKTVVKKFVNHGVDWSKIEERTNVKLSKFAFNFTQDDENHVTACISKKKVKFAEEFSKEFQNQGEDKPAWIDDVKKLLTPETAEAASQQG